jgi:hypothetical protein
MAISFRRLRRIDPESFARDIERLDLITGSSDALNCLVSQYNDGIFSLIDKHAPVVTKNVVLSQPRLGSLMQCDRRKERCDSQRGFEC